MRNYWTPRIVLCTIILATISSILLGHYFSLQKGISAFVLTLLALGAAYAIRRSLSRVRLFFMLTGFLCVGFVSWSVSVMVLTRVFGMGSDYAAAVSMPFYLLGLPGIWLGKLLAKRAFPLHLDPGQGTDDWPKPLTPLTQEEAEALWAVRLGETYRKRWGIETGYRVKKDFRAKTCSVSPSIRFVFLFLSIILYNTWTLLNKDIPPDQYQQSRHIHPYNRTETPKPANLTITTTTLRWLYILIFSPVPLLPLNHWT